MIARNRRRCLVCRILSLQKRVRSEETTAFGYPLTRVEIVDEQGEALLGRPRGNYLTLDLPQLPQQREELLRLHHRADELPALHARGPRDPCGQGHHGPEGGELLRQGLDQMPGDQ